MIQQNDLPPNDFAAIHFIWQRNDQYIKKCTPLGRNKLRNSQVHPTTVFFIKTHQNQEYPSDLSVNGQRRVS